MNRKPFCRSEIVYTNQQALLDLITFFQNGVVVMEKAAADRLQCSELLLSLQNHGHLVWVDESFSNPTQSEIARALVKINSQKVDKVLAIGGGSAIDLAKAISAFYRTDRVLSIAEITQQIKAKTYVNEGCHLDIIAVPTTSGTGSEVTKWATIWDYQDGGKYSIEHELLKPSLALMIPSLTLSVPYSVTLATGLDALSHACEAYWAKATNPLAQDLAYRAIEIIMEHLPKLLEDLNNLNERQALMRGSSMAALAFSQTRTAAAHSISYPLTQHFHVPHGIAVAMSLDLVAKANHGHFPHDEALFSLFERFGGLQTWLANNTQKINGLKLSNYKIKKEDLPFIAARAFTEGRMDNNPFKFEEASVMQLLTKIL